MRLFIFESHPVQYHAPVYRELHRLCQSSGQGAIQVFYATDASLRGHFDAGFASNVAWDEPLLNGYPASVLNVENGTPLRGFNSLTGKSIFSLLRRERPDAVMLTGLAYRFDWAAYFACLLLHIPIWLRTETQDEAFSRGRLKSILRSIVYRRIYGKVQNALTIGRLNAAHYTNHGLQRHVFSPYCVVDRFAQIDSEQRQSWRRQVRYEAGFRDDLTVLLFCGKLEPKKNPDALLHVLARMPCDERRRYGVLYVGSGVLDGELRVKAGSLKDVKVSFAGFKNQTELARYYLAADILILPSRKMGETWGLVVNEALLAGCQVLVSRHAGCHADFSELPGVHVFDGSSEGLLDALRMAPRHIDVEVQRAFMERYSVHAAAAGIAQAMEIDAELLPEASRPVSSPTKIAIPQAPSHASVT